MTGRKTKETTGQNVQDSFFWAQQPPVGQGFLIHELSRLHTTTHHSRQDSSGRVIISSQRPLPDNKQQSQVINIYAPGGIRTHNLSRRAAADPRLRPHGHWDRQDSLLASINAPLMCLSINNFKGSKLRYTFHCYPLIFKVLQCCTHEADSN